MSGKEYRMNRLVAQYFVVNPHPEKFNVVNHIDGVKTNDFYTNLEWCDTAYNNQHAVDIGLTPSRAGVMNGRAILKEEDVFHIWKTDMPVDEIAEKYGLTKGSAMRVRNGYNWNHLKERFYDTVGENFKEEIRVKRKEEKVLAESSLSEDGIRKVHEMAQRGIPSKEIEILYKISRSTVYAIKYKKTAVSQLILDGYIHNP